MKTERIKRTWRNGGERVTTKEFVAKINAAIKANSGIPIMFVENLIHTTSDIHAKKHEYGMGVAGLVYQNPLTPVQHPSNSKIIVPLFQRYDLAISEDHLLSDLSKSGKIEINQDWLGLPTSSRITLEKSRFHVPLLNYAQRTAIRGPVEVRVGEREVRDYFLANPARGDELFEYLNLDKGALENLLTLSPEERARILKTG